MSLLQLLGAEVVLSTLLFALVWPLSRLLPPRWCRLRHLLWALVLVRLVLPPGLGAPWSLWSLASVSGVELPVVSTHGAELDAPGVLGTPRPRTFAGVSSGLDWAPMPLWGMALLALWALGAVGVGSVMIARRHTYRALARTAAPVTQPDLLAKLEHWRKRMRVRRRVRLVLSGAVRSPFTIGSLHPVIVLPGRVGRAPTPEFVDCAIAHEMAHVRHWDDLWLQLQAAVTSVYFFHPVAWAAARQVRDAAEQVCDQAVLLRGRMRPRTYGGALLDFLRWGTPGSAHAVSALAAAPRRTTRRFEAIMQPSFLRPRAAVSWTAAVLVAVGQCATGRLPKLPRFAPPPFPYSGRRSRTPYPGRGSRRDTRPKAVIR